MHPKLTDDEKYRVKDLRAAIRRTRQRSSEAVYGSEDYWKYSKEELDGEDQISDLRFRALQRNSDLSDPSFERAAQEYKVQKERRGAKRLSILEKEKIFVKRNKILQQSSSTTANRTSTRAAYVDLLLTIQSKTGRQKQSDFSKDGLRAYGGTTKVNNSTYCFSVLDGTRRDKDGFVAAHIFPPSIGPGAMEYIFGRDARYEINSPRNALLLPKKIEKHFSAHQIVIVPARSDNSDVREWQFLIVDKSGLWNEYVSPFGPMRFSDLHERKLIFPNDFRPQARYLYFHYLISMIIHFRAAKKTGIVRSELPDAEWPELMRAWATHGEYLRDNMIYGFMEEFGHDLPEDLKENALAHCAPIRSNSEAEELDEVIDSLGMIQIGSDNDDDEDDDDDDEDDDENSLFNAALKQSAAVRRDLDAFAESPTSGPAALQGQISASLTSFSRTIDDYSSLSKKELIPAKQEKAFERVKNFRTELADYRLQFDRLRKEREEAQVTANRNELLGRRPHNAATPENPYAQSNLSAQHSAFASPHRQQAHASGGLSFGASPSDYNRETHALREQSFLANTNNQIDEFLDRGRAVLADLGQQREMLKGTQRRLYSVANTLGVSGDTIRMIERRAKQDKWIFWAGLVIFILFCWAVLHFLR
ncbi:HNHc domain-containing protein [Trichophyton interdigitale]|uniref:HNHc domain-containing protein n=1 Tax=Trichophyton interdigitale TaxID=101480 RepID=A0A9P5CYV1_9EURO|nr:HNHc domain-containing protein [Trichophyton interdigitale]KAF3898147.1 HNHc domain-containing protein [Trichophyton interdigitale]KAG8211655.1 HNHc domain-containing protein [Trichophyton interdigitale]